MPAARIAPTPEPPAASDWEPSDIDSEPGMMERVGSVFTAPVPLLWQGATFPIWMLLLLLLLMVIALMVIARQMLKRNREY